MDFSHECISTHAHTRKYAHTQTYTHRYKFIHTMNHAHTDTNTHKRTYTYTHIHTHKHTRTHTHTHTRMHTPTIAIGDNATRYIALKNHLNAINAHSLSHIANFRWTMAAKVDSADRSTIVVGL